MNDSLSAEVSAKNHQSVFDIIIAIPHVE